MTETTLIRCKVLKVGSDSKKFYKEGDFILIKANHIDPVPYVDCPKDIKMTYNEDNVFCKINE